MNSLYTVLADVEQQFLKQTDLIFLNSQCSINNHWKTHFPTNLGRLLVETKIFCHALVFIAKEKLCLQNMSHQWKVIKLLNTNDVKNWGTQSITNK